jgi:diacylglycerol kinase family enzyme
LIPTTPPIERQRPLVVVFNTGSGRSDAAAVATAIEQACRDAKRSFALRPVDDPRHLGAIAREAVAHARATGGVVVAAGGDGTINAVAQATLGSGCPFGVLPRGTFNYFSRTHGIPAELPAALDVLLNEMPQPAQVGLVNDRIFLVNASLGLYPQLLEEREAWKQQLGRSQLVALGAGVATALRGHRNLRLEMELHGQVRQLRTPTLFVGNNALQMEQVGLDKAQAIDGGALAGVVLQPLSRWKLLALLVRGGLGQLHKAEDVIDFSFKRLTVLPSRRVGGQRLKVATDGEITWMSLPLTFSVSPEPLLLIRPRGLAPERQAAAGVATEPA